MSDIFTATLRPDGIREYRFTEATRAAIDAWYETTTRHDAEYAERGEHIMRLIIFEKLIMPTPYTVQRARQAAEIAPPNLQESTAIVPHQSLALRITLMFVQKLPIAPETVRVFPNEALAVEWLKARDDNFKGKQTTSQP